MAVKRATTRDALDGSVTAIDHAGRAVEDSGRVGGHGADRTN
ncbi:hypothetical protein J2751_000972 [Halorubrum alkaliphilum]|uniref:Uncharacterized protein n=1 Tax=Halorubrum alkaliphilum TaxID=261290 RepID=A0A8T4GDZ5_9EURY|nr:hypothetical protein [Halorubrum alkaliphilum]MBP1921967.1 hypothetical protein [Halorubrum alkaliphilum]